MCDSNGHERQRQQDDVGDSGAEKGCHAGDFAAKCAAAVCAEIGYTGIPIIIKSDQEAAMKAVVEDIARWRAPAKISSSKAPSAQVRAMG